MQFVTYWKVSEEKSTSDIVETGRTLIESDAFPPEGVEIVRWDATVDGWGINVFEAETYEDVLRAHMAWREVSPGWFEEIKTAPSGSAVESVSMMEDQLAELSNLV